MGNENKIKLPSMGLFYTFLIVLVLISLAASAFPRIDAGHRGVVLKFGAVQDNILGEGIHFVIPVLFTVKEINVQTRVFESTTTAASQDLQDVSTTVALNYHLEPLQVNEIYQTLGVRYELTYISPAIQEVVKASAAKFNAAQLITQRPKVKAAIEAGLKERLEGRGIIVETVSITDFTFSQEFTGSIEAKVKAEQDALRAENDLRRIEIEAKQIEATAKGRANALVANAEGESRSIELIEAQLSGSPNYIEWLKIQKWDGVLPRVTGGVTPFIDVTEESK